MITIQIFVFVFGLCIGSFLNVVITRLPHSENLWPRSKCPNCAAPVFWYHNIPVFSFIWLRGKCRNCHQRISWRYPFVELLMGFAALYLFPDTLSWKEIIIFLFYFTTASILVSHLFIDIAHQILPDGLNLLLFFIFLSFVIIFKHWTFWVLGGVVGFVLPLGVTWLYYIMRGQIGLGGGDIKLYGILGMFLGVKGIMFNMFLSCAVGAVFGLIMIAFGKMNKDKPLAFGPFIIIVAVFQIYFPDLIELVQVF